MIKPIDEGFIPLEIHGNKGHVIQQLLDFIESGEKAGEYDTNGQNAKNAYQSLYYGIKAHNLPLVALRRGDRVFVVRKDVAE